MVSRESRANIDGRERDGSAAPAVELRDVTGRFRVPNGQEFTALRDLSSTVRAGELCGIAEPTGCGKSTALLLIAGLEAPSRWLPSRW